MDLTRCRITHSDYSTSSPAHATPLGDAVQFRGTTGGDGHHTGLSSLVKIITNDHHIQGFVVRKFKGVVHF